MVVRLIPYLAASFLKPQPCVKYSWMIWSFKSILVDFVVNLFQDETIKCSLLQRPASLAANPMLCVRPFRLSKLSGWLKAKLHWYFVNAFWTRVVVYRIRYDLNCLIANVCWFAILVVWTNPNLYWMISKTSWLILIVVWMIFFVIERLENFIERGQIFIERPK